MQSGEVENGHRNGRSLRKIMQMQQLKGLQGFGSCTWSVEVLLKKDDANIKEKYTIDVCLANF